MSKLNIKHIKTSSFHLILEVDNNFQEFLSNLSAQINGRYKGSFVVNNHEYKAHITLYLFSAPIKNIPEIINKVEILNTKIKKIKVKIDKMIMSDTGWIMIDVDSEKKQLLAYHKTAVKLLNPLREGALRKKYRNTSYFETLTVKEKKSLIKYGDKHAMEEFHSHLSVAHFDTKEITLKVFSEYKKIKLPKYLQIKCVQLIRSIGNESGGVGKILYNKKL